MRLRSVGQALHRVRPVQRTRRPGLSGRRPGRGARDHATRRGRLHGSTRYASIADDSEVDPDRPIKCCDGMYSIFHYPPAPAMRGGEALQGVPAIGEILTAAMFRRCVLTRQRAMRVQIPVPLVTRVESSRYVRGSGSLRHGQGIRSGQNKPTYRRKSRWHSTDPVRAHSDAAGDVVDKGENSGRRIAGPSIGRMAAADDAGGESPAWPAKRPGRAPG
ncbi:hypothetical protein D5R55_31160 [Burkholderia cenocepacia]|uniref:Uncharacterized protein n=1 Tax=Burkholderia cenocepacia TaxID=95486 RepID=A0A3Q9FCF5_9BURK|nr:hypothetical protein D5R55_31160 [Burkholderia cenocepacia]